MINDDVEPPLKKQQRGNCEDKSFSSKDRGKAIACIEEGPKLPNGEANDPVSFDHEEENAIGLLEKKAIDHLPQEANSSHISTGMPAYQITVL